MIIVLKGADFSQSNIGTTNSYKVTYHLSGGINREQCPTSIPKNEAGTAAANNFTAKFALTDASNTVESCDVKVKGTTVDVDPVKTGTEVTLTLTAAQITGNVEITIVATESAGGSGGGSTTTPGAISSYIKDPWACWSDGKESATSGYYSVVDYPVSANTDYIIPYGRNWFCEDSSHTYISGGAANGAEKAVITTPANAAYLTICFKPDEIASSDVTITKRDADDITAYISDGVGITSISGPSTLNGFFTVVDYPVTAGSRYKIPYGRNGYFSNASGVVSTSIFQGQGAASFVTPVVPSGATMISVCFKHDDIAQADVTIEETSQGNISSNPDTGVTTTSYGGEVKTGYMVTTTGTLNASSNVNTIDMIPVKPSTKYQLVNGCRNTAVLNSAGEIIKAWGGSTLTNIGNIVTTTEDTAYLRTCYYWVSNTYPELSVATFTLTEVTG